MSVSRDREAKLTLGIIKCVKVLHISALTTEVGSRERAALVRELMKKLVTSEIKEQIPTDIMARINAF